MRANGESMKLYDCSFEMGNRFRSSVQTLTAAVTIDRDSAQLLFLDPGGAARNVTMPTAETGLFFWIQNTADAAEDLVIKNPATTTIGTISQNEGAFVVSDGTNWFVTMVGTST